MTEAYQNEMNRIDREQRKVMPDFWDDPEMFNSGTFIKFETVGDSVAGTITAISKHTFDDGTVVPQIELDTPDGPRTLTAGQVRLKLELKAQKPKVGDLLTITFTGIEKRPGGKTVKDFAVSVGQGAPPPAWAVAQPATSGPPVAPWPQGGTYAQSATQGPPAATWAGVPAQPAQPQSWPPQAAMDATNAQPAQPPQPAPQPAADPLAGAGLTPEQIAAVRNLL